MITDYLPNAPIFDGANTAINATILGLTTSIRSLSQENIKLTKKIASINDDSHRINEENRLLLSAILQELQQLNMNIQNLGGVK